MARQASGLCLTPPERIPTLRCEHNLGRMSAIRIVYRARAGESPRAMLAPSALPGLAVLIAQAARWLVRPPCSPPLVPRAERLCLQAKRRFHGACARLAADRRGGRAVECAGLENRYGRFRPSRVRIPPSPLEAWAFPGGLSGSTALLI